MFNLSLPTALFKFAIEKSFASNAAAIPGTDESISSLRFATETSGRSRFVLRWIRTKSAIAQPVRPFNSGINETTFVCHSPCSS
jgi:hypothetical protein